MTQIKLSDDAARDLLSEARMMLIPASQRTGRADDLVLHVTFEERPYLLGEPIIVRCRILNDTDQPITIPYSQPSFSIETPEGDRVPHLTLVVACGLLGGPPPKTIPPGQQFVHEINLAVGYELVTPGTFNVTAEYSSPGRYYDLDPETKTRIAKPAWEGRLTANAGRLDIVEPREKQDRDALEMLIVGLGLLGEGRWHKFRYATLFWDNRNSPAVIDKHPQSYYSGYARFFLYDDRLRRGQWRAHGIAERALPLLEGIELARYPELFQEMVLHRLILVNIGVGSPPERLAPLVEEFRSRFPDSPYLLPEEARKAAP